MKSKPNKEYDLKHYLMPKLLLRLLNTEMISSEALKLIMDERIYHVHSIRDCFNVKIDWTRLVEAYGKHSNLLGNLAKASPEQNDETLWSDKSTLDNSQITKNLDTEATTDSAISGGMGGTAEEAFEPPMSEMLVGYKHIKSLTALGLDNDTAEELLNWFICAFFAKYKSSNFDGISRLDKFENSMMNFIRQQLISKKFKKKYNMWHDMLKPEVIGQCILKYIIDHEWIRIDGTKITHDEENIEVEHARFESVM